MKRNLESRVEVVVPVEDPALRANLREVLDVQLSAAVGAWDMQPDGSYTRRQGGPDAKSAQQLLVELAEKRSKGATRRRRKKPRSFARRATR
jgi:polyphosphate kinase